MVNAENVEEAGIVETQRRFAEEPDFVGTKSSGYSLDRLVERYPDGCPDHVLGAAAGIPEEDVPAEYAGVVERMQDIMGLTSEDVEIED